MTDHERLLALLRRHEGLRLTVYDDATGKPLKPGMTLVGHPTIGYGRALDVNGISEAEADFLLDAGDMPRHRRALRLLLQDGTIPTEALHDGMKGEGPILYKHGLGEVRQAVLINMLHQMGLDGLRGFRRMLTALRAHAYSLAADEMLDSRWAREQSPERAAELAAMMRTGEWPND